MVYKLYSNITCPNPIGGATENIGEKIFLYLLRNVINVKHGKS